MIRLRQEGYSLRYIARYLGISHETVRRATAGVKPKTLSATDIARELHRAYSFVRKRLADLQVEGPGSGAKYRLTHVVAQSINKPCTMCGRPIPARRRTYCSANCWRESLRYVNWSERRKDLHRQSCREYWQRKRQNL